jgi:hypothetical protein
MRKFAFVIVMLVARVASAQQIDLKSLDKLADRAKSKTEINMDGAALKSAASSLNDKQGDEAIAKKTVETMSGFFMRAFEFDKDGVFKLDDLKPILDQLKAPDWKNIIRVKEDDELVEIWIHSSKGEPDGMVLIAAESSEVVVMNGVGVTDLNDLKALGKLDPIK